MGTNKQQFKKKKKKEEIVLKLHPIENKSED